MKRFDQTRPEFSPYGFTCELWTPARMPRPDRHNEVEINLLKSGSLTYLLGGHRITIAARRLAVFWAAIPHQIVDFDGKETYFVVTVPLSGFLAAGLDLSVVNRILNGEVVIDSDHDACDELKFQQWEQDLREGDPRVSRPYGSRYRPGWCDSPGSSRSVERRDTLSPRCRGPINWPATSLGTITSR